MAPASWAECDGQITDSLSVLTVETSHRERGTTGFAVDPSPGVRRPEIQGGVSGNGATTSRDRKGRQTTQISELTDTLNQLLGLSSGTELEVFEPLLPPVLTSVAFP